MSAAQALAVLVKEAAEIVGRLPTEVRGDMTPEEIGFDALDWLNFGCAVEEQLGKVLPVGLMDELAERNATFVDIAEAVRLRCRVREDDA